MTGIILWEEPPASPRMKGGAPPKYKTFFDELRKNPGRWAKFADDVAPSVSNQITAGRFSGIKPGEFQGTFRASTGKNVTPRRGAVYARYIGSTS